MFDPRRFTRRFAWAYPYVIAAFAAVGAACSTADLKPANGQAVADPSGGPVLDEEGNPIEPVGGVDGGRDPAPAAKLGPVTSAVTIQLQPTDAGAAILAAIKGAKTSVHMTMYLLSSDEMITALVNLKKAGKDVKVLLNQNFPPNGGDNTAAYNTLKSKGVPVEWASDVYTFTHAKTIIIDSEKVLIMTMNLTYSSPTTNREFIATDTDPQDVADVEKLFAADYVKAPVAVTSKLVVSPSTTNTIEPRTQLKALIDSAKTSLAVEAQSLSDTTLVDAIILAHQAKVDVKVVIDLDTSKSAAQVKTIAKLKQNGVPLRALKNPDIHAKVIVVDETLTFVGSQNLTATALNDNREIGVITDAKAEATKVRATITSDFDKGVVP